VYFETQTDVEFILQNALLLAVKRIKSAFCRLLQNSKDMDKEHRRCSVI